LQRVDRPRTADKPYVEDVSHEVELDGHKFNEARKKKRKIFGVCGRLAEDFGISATLLRVAFVVCTIFSSALGFAFFVPFLVYCGLAFVVRKS